MTEERGVRETRLRRLAVQLVAQMGSETPEDMATALRYANELVDGFIRPSPEDQRQRLHSISGGERLGGGRQT